MGVSIVFAVVVARYNSKGSVVEILQDGVCIQRIDLAKVTSSYSFEIQDPRGGSNVIWVEPGRICVKEADCPDRVCVQQGWIQEGLLPIVCLPHRLVIRFVERQKDTEVDVVVK